MTTVTQLARQMQTLLTTTADRLARDSGFVRRRRKLTGSTFARALVLGWLDDPHATGDQLARAAAAAGAAVTPRALTKRLGPAAAEFLRRLLAAATSLVVRAAPAVAPVLDRFSEVIVLDSTTIALPDALAATWRGCGGKTGRGTAAAVKVTVGLDLRPGRLLGPGLGHGRGGDLDAPLAAVGPAEGGLQIGDLNYFDLGRFAARGRRGGYWLSRLKARAIVLDRHGRRLDLVAEPRRAGEAAVDRPVLLGAEARLPCRLVARRVPAGVARLRRERLVARSVERGDRPSAEALALCDWTILVTNVPAEVLSVGEATTLYRLRWQIELIFKQWKGQGGLASWRTGDPYRVLCEVYAKLVAAVVKHWLIVVGCWSQADRSPTKAGRVVAGLAAVIGAGLAGVGRLAAAIRRVQASLAIGCRMTRRRGRPNAHQLFARPPAHAATGAS